MPQELKNAFCRIRTYTGLALPGSNQFMIRQSVLCDSHLCQADLNTKVYKSLRADFTHRAPRPPLVPSAPATGEGSTLAPLR